MCDVFALFWGLKLSFRRPNLTECFTPLADDGITQKRVRPHRLRSG